MSAGNRKNQYRPPAQPVKKSDAWSGYIMLLAFIALVGVALGSALVR